MEDAKLLEEFLSKNGKKIYYVLDDYNEKKSLKDGWIKETEYGDFEDYNDFLTDCMTFFADKEINAVSKQESIIRTLASHLKITEEEINKDTAYLICTGNREVIDFKKLKEVSDTGIEPEERASEWRKPVSEYKANKITQHTNAKYTPDYKRIIPAFKAFLSLFLFNDSEQIDYFLGLLGRLLLGRNDWKEFATIIGLHDTGKTRFLGYLFSMLGSYASVITKGFFYGTDDDSSINKTASQLRHKRLVAISELSATKKAKTDHLKRLTGNDLFFSRSGSFSVDFKILVMTNKPVDIDNTNDEAYDRREKNFLAARQSNGNSDQSFDELLALLIENIDAVFSYLIHVGVKSIGVSKPENQPVFLKDIQKIIRITQNPVPVFATTACRKTPDQNCETARDLYVYFQVWFKHFEKYFAEYLRFLSHEYSNFYMPSQNAFNEQLKVHYIFIPHTNKGDCFTNIEFMEDKIYWSNTLDFKRNSPKCRKQKSSVKHILTR
jgi:hypothetical protein